MVKVNIEEGLVQAQKYVEHVDILLLLRLPPFSSLHQVLLSIRMCNFKTLGGGGAKLVWMDVLKVWIYVIKVWSKRFTVWKWWLPKSIGKSRSQRREGREVNRSMDQEWIYLTGEQISINLHPKETLLAISSQ